MAIAGFSSYMAVATLFSTRTMVRFSISGTCVLSVSPNGYGAPQL